MPSRFAQAQSSSLHVCAGCEGSVCVEESNLGGKMLKDKLVLHNRRHGPPSRPFPIVGGNEEQGMEEGWEASKATAGHLLGGRGTVEGCGHRSDHTYTCTHAQQQKSAHISTGQSHIFLMLLLLELWRVSTGRDGTNQ